MTIVIEANNHIIRYTGSLAEVKNALEPEFSIQVLHAQHNAIYIKLYQRSKKNRS